MKTNFHTHSTFCDGKNTPEEIVLSAIDKGFAAIGFSGHGYTDFDLSYCMKDTDGYIAEIDRLKALYGDKIEILLGIEEDMFAHVDRSRFDYIIGSSHYLCVDGGYYAIDSSLEKFQKCISLFDGDIIKLADSYYTAFCDYIMRRRPDVVGHFDLITKFDEIDSGRFSSNKQYCALAEKYMDIASRSGCIFEINSGAMSRGVRTSPYPAENILDVLKRNDARIMISADSHSKDTLDFGFDEMRKMLLDIGFRYTYVLTKGEPIKVSL